MFAGCADRLGGRLDETTISETYDATDLESMVAETANDGVTITGQDRDTVALEAVKRRFTGVSRDSDRRWAHAAAGWQRSTRLPAEPAIRRLASTARSDVSRPSGRCRSGGLGSRPGRRWQPAEGFRFTKNIFMRKKELFVYALYSVVGNMTPGGERPVGRGGVLPW